MPIPSRAGELLKECGKEEADLEQWRRTRPPAPYGTNEFWTASKKLFGFCCLREEAKRPAIVGLLPLHLAGLFLP